MSPKKKKITAEAQNALKSYKKRSAGYSTMGEEISKQVQHAIDHAPTKTYLCRLLGISFPTIQDRLYADSWTAREKLILRENGIIKGKWYDVDYNTNPRMVEGEGTLYPGTKFSIRRSRLGLTKDKGEDQ